jgi:hypothetical protein
MDARKRKRLYEYIAMYVDNFLIVARAPGKIIKEHSEIHKFKLNGMGPLTYHLSCEYFRDTDGILCYGPRKYIIKLIDQYEIMFGCKLCEYLKS